ncbi:NAD(P)-dependent dehydrogenase (short-subunit alcohol dehydrogenase family) [Aquimarina sp. EL_43]|uniref:SDR family NAD(P)-dependent oxidoreductase n=1 Tax=unclassified Aquimarina TaxID=2627091 RepID=UPI0018C9582C|nr:MULTISPECIES: glucose 1-dehydrogenase [unclassified Aquimarina]MBG6129861.1 NAD(P)-dependent dehydrogenase (short-subunit alcohol dehydrogenase family) [Aquimarina sp. EL_35]MBG6150926.1 NAD(P)-dependent dehydrogenase (short-subunit alcohol dehydrogenase family) [Aquimarina sp. EL_32]MBG6167767.1 NAD(P)-dependent dehydrogenase (short-subunit alcohol dehydrogenase family) [Aquimarina sp. EL_43]
MKKLQNKVAVITGANSGIGLATAKLYLQEGAKVVLSGRRQEALDEAAKALEGDLITVKADVAKAEDNKRLIEEATTKYGKIDVLFLNAGIAPVAPTHEITEEHYDTLFNTNVKGPILATKEALPHINDGGAILFTNSIVSQKGFDGLGVYSATKGALRAYQRVLTSEVKSRGIRVNSIAPGPIETPLYGKMGLPEDVVEEMGKGFAQQVPLGRFGTSEEVAKSALFLASEDASFINGVDLEIDGGLSQI